MKDHIKVLGDMSDVSSKFAEIGRSVSNINTIMSKIDIALDDTGKWDGDNHIKCKEIHSLIKQYFEKTVPLFDEFDECFVRLCKSSGTFAADSPGCQKLKGW